MCLHDPVRNEQAEAAAAAAGTSPELREDTLFGLWRDAAPLVRDRDSYPAVVRSDADRDLAFAVAKRVLDDVPDHLRELVGIGPDLRQLAVLLDHKSVGCLTGGDDAGNASTYRRRHVDDLCAELEPARIDT